MNINHGEEFYFLGCNTVYSVENQPTFRRNMSPPPSGPKNKRNKLSMKQVASRLSMLYAAVLLGLFFGPEGGGDMFLQNVG
jgi:hypothetical protein